MQKRVHKTRELEHKVDIYREDLKSESSSLYILRSIKLVGFKSTVSTIAWLKMAYSKFISDEHRN